MIGVLLVVALAGLIGGAILLNRPPLTEPPGPRERLTSYLTTNVAELRADSAFPELRPRVHPVPPRELFDAARAAIAELGWEVLREDAERLELHAVATTPLLRFRDDVRVQVQAAAGGSRLYARSQSRVGRADLGANAQHLRRLAAATAAQVGG
jgi:hypothetical protein